MYWIEQNHVLITWMGTASLLMLIGSIMILPWLLSLIPEDYFAHKTRVPAKWKQAHPVIRISVLIVKNLAGLILLLAGILMLILPGQGLISILIALILMDYPGKFRFERWIISQPALFRVVNRLRSKRGKPELLL
jgi:hypothetical protein